MAVINLTSTTGSGFMEADFQQIKDALQDGGVDVIQLSIVQTTTTGNGLSITRNLAAASTNSAVVSIVQDNSSDDQTALIIQQDGAGEGINITQNYAGAATVAEFVITNTANTRGLLVNNNSSGANTNLVCFGRGNSDTDGANFLLRDVTSSATSGPVLTIRQDQASDDQIALQITQDGTNSAINCIGAIGRTSGIVEYYESGSNTYAQLVGARAYPTNSFYRNLTSTDTAGALILITQDNAGDDQNALVIQQDAGVSGVVIYQNGSGAGLQVINTASSTQPDMQLNHNSTTALCPAIYFGSTHTSATAATFEAPYVDTSKTGNSGFVSASHGTFTVVGYLRINVGGAERFIPYGTIA